MQLICNNQWGSFLTRDLSTTLQGRSKGNPFPQKRLKTPAPGRLGLAFVLLVEVLFCLGRLRRGALRPNAPLIPPPRFPCGMAEQRNKLPQKPSGGKAPRHLKAHSPSRWMVPPRRVFFPKVFPRVLCCLA